MNDLKSHIDDKFAFMKVDPEMEERVRRSIGRGKERKRGTSLWLKRGIRPFKKAIAAGLAACLCLGGAGTALAAGIPAVNDLLFKVSPELAESLYPIQKAAEDQGIRLEVLYGANDDQRAVIYFSVQDLTGERVDDTTDIYNYSSSMRGMSLSNCQLIHFDPETRTAYFRMTETASPGMNGRMLRFCVDSFLSGKVEHHWYDTGIFLADVLAHNPKPKTRPLTDYDYSGGSYLADEETFSVLEPDQMAVSLGGDTDFVTVSNVGYVDGKLHVQTKWTERVDSHGALFLAEKGMMPEDATSWESDFAGNGRAVRANNYYFMTDTDTEKGEMRSTHIEYVFDVKEGEDLSQFVLWAKFTEDGSYTKGEWSVNFRMAAAEQIRIDDKPELAESIALSPLGVYLNDFRADGAEKLLGDQAGSLVKVVLRDGTEASLSGCYSIEEDESGWLAYSFERPVELTDIAAVYVGGQVVYEGSD